MLQYTIKRLLLAIPTLLGISLLSFLIMHMAPGDPVDLFLGGGSGGAGGEGISTDRRADADKTREELRRQLGLDKPLHIQYLNWLSNIVLRVEDLDGFERGALMADSVLNGLTAAKRSELESMEQVAYREAFLGEFRRVNPERVDEFIESDFWQTMPAQPFSFAIAGTLGLPPDVAQQLLETTSTQERLDAVLNLLNSSFRGR